MNVNPDDPGCDMDSTEHTFICGNGDEIPFEWVNDGEVDCPDGADEQQYETDGSEMNWFDCHDGSEIWIHQVNDGTDDCAYGEDESHGTDDGGDDLEIASMDVDIWFEQWDDSSMEFVMVQRMVIDDAETIAAYAMMADSFFGNGDGEVTQNEVDTFVLMMSEEALDDFDMSEIMRLDGNPGMLVDAWMDIEGLVEGDSEVTMVMGQVVVFAATPYADSTTHTFTIADDDDSSDDSGTDPVEDCEIDSIWIHNSETWSVSSITDSAGALSFEYDEYNNAWFSGDCPDDSEVVTFTLVKRDGGELPDDTVDDDWEDMDMNKFPMCAYAYAAIMADGTMEARAGIDTAPESGDYTIDLADGAQYRIFVVCMDPEGEDMTVTIHNADLNLTSTYTATAEAEASLLLSVPVGYDGTYVFDVTWTDGHHTESGTLTVNGMGDGTGGDLDADGDGFLPGFTAALGIVALLGAAMICSRRN
jgi:PGF-CTERM protein